MFLLQQILLKKWFNQECYLKKIKVQEAVREYNIAKTDENKARVFACKKDYKYFAESVKKYNHERCKKMNEVRKTKTKEFWRTFKSKNKSPLNNISDNDFFEYFKNVSSEIEETIPEEVKTFVENFDSTENDTTSTFSSLDDPISRKKY